MLKIDLAVLRCKDQNTTADIGVGGGEQLMGEVLWSDNHVPAKLLTT